MKLLYTILLICFSLVSTGQATPINKELVATKGAHAFKTTPPEDVEKEDLSPTVAVVSADEIEVTRNRQFLFTIHNSLFTSEQEKAIYIRCCSLLI